MWIYHRHVKSEMFIRHPSGDIKSRVKYVSLTFRGKVQVRHENSGFGNHYILSILLKQLPSIENNKVYISKNQNS